MPFRVMARAVLIGMLCHVSIDVVGLYEHDEAVCVSVEKSNVIPVNGLEVVGVLAVDEIFDKSKMLMPTYTG